MKPSDSEYNFIFGSEKVVFIEHQLVGSRIPKWETIVDFSKNENYDLVRSMPGPKIGQQESGQ
jgi:hypothetical protein